MRKKGCHSRCFVHMCSPSYSELSFISCLYSLLFVFSLALFLSSLPCLLCGACIDKNCRKEDNRTTAIFLKYASPKFPVFLSLSDGDRFSCLGALLEGERRRERGELVTVATRRVTLRQWHMHREGEKVGRGECW